MIYDWYVKSIQVEKKLKIMCMIFVNLEIKYLFLIPQGH